MPGLQGLAQRTESTLLLFVLGLSAAGKTTMV